MKSEGREQQRDFHSSTQGIVPLGLGTALSLMDDATLYTVLPTHTAEASIALSSVGIILGVNRVVRLFLNGPAGLAYDRWPRRLFVPALFIGSLSTTVYAATRGFWPMLKGVTDNGNRIQRKQARASARAYQPAFTGL